MSETKIKSKQNVIRSSSASSSSYSLSAIEDTDEEQEKSLSFSDTDDSTVTGDIQLENNQYSHLDHISVYDDIGRCAALRSPPAAPPRIAHRRDAVTAARLAAQHALALWRSDTWTDVESKSSNYSVHAVHMAREADSGAWRARGRISAPLDAVWAFVSAHAHRSDVDRRLSDARVRTVEAFGANLRVMASRAKFRTPLRDREFVFLSVSSLFSFSKWQNAHV